MRKILNSVSWGFLLVFLIPTFLIMGSWNSLPGEPLYNVKLGFEQVLLFFAKPSYAASGTLHIKYTERRLSEASTLLTDRASVEGLDYLERQVATTKAVITQAPNPALKKSLAQDYIVTLRQAVGELETHKQALAPPTGPRVPTPTRTRMVTQPPAAPSATPAPTLMIPPEDIEQEIEDTEDEIEETIEELEEILEAGASSSGSTGEDHGRGEEKREERDERREERQEENEGKEKDGDKGKND